MSTTKKPDDKQPTLPMTSAAAPAAPEAPARIPSPTTPVTVTFEGPLAAMIHMEVDRLALENRERTAPTPQYAARHLLTLGADVRALTFVPARFADDDALLDAPAPSPAPEAPPVRELTPKELAAAKTAARRALVLDGLMPAIQAGGGTLRITARAAAEKLRLPGVTGAHIAQVFAVERASGTGPLRVEKGAIEALPGEPSSQRTVWTLAFAEAPAAPPPVEKPVVADPIAVIRENMGRAVAQAEWKRPVVLDGSTAAPPAPSPPPVAAPEPARAVDPIAATAQPEVSGLTGRALVAAYDIYLARVAAHVATLPGRTVTWTVADLTAAVPGAPGHSRKGLGRVLGCMASTGTTRGGLRVLTTDTTRIVERQVLALHTFAAV